MRLLQYIVVLGTLLLSTMVATATPKGDVRCEVVVRATHISTGGMNLWVAFDNPRCHALVIKRAEVDIYVDERYMMSISLRDKVVIPRRGKSEVLLPLRFASQGGLKTIAMLRRVVAQEQDITFSYRIRGGTRLLKRTFSAENIAISEFFDNFAIPNTLLEELGYVLE